jgi:DNA-binding SARP family transcriptional activator
MNSLHALIVEDLDFWQDAMHEVLSDAGYRVWVASSYDEALEALAQHEYHLAVIDPVLDDANRHNRDGLRVLQHILDERLDTCALDMQSARVLIVEDEPEWQDIVSELLADEGHTCRAAHDYESALAQLDQESFNVVFLDMMLHQFDLPVRGGSGWRLLDLLVEGHPRTKVVVLSGRATAGEAARLVRDYPIAAFIDKGEEDVEAQIMEAVRQAMQAPSLRIQTFGQFNVWRDGQLIDPWKRVQAQTVVKLLLVRRAAGGRAVSPDELMEWLWPESDPESGRKKLLPLLSNARRTLEPDIEPRDSNFILRSSNGYYFDLGGDVTWDVHDFWRLVREAGVQERAGELEAAIAAYKGACALYVGDFLAEDRYAPWAIPQRQALQDEYRDSLASLAEAHAALGRYADAVRAGEAALKVDPLLESVYRQLMRYHYCAGDKGQALKVYRNCEKLFDELFGEGPTPQTRHLLEAISNNAELDC